VLRRQADSLIQHQERSLTELANMENNFSEKRRKLMESSEEFNRQMEKYSKNPVPDAEAFQKLVDAALQQIKQQHEEQQKKAKEAPQQPTTTALNERPEANQSPSDQQSVVVQPQPNAYSSVQQYPQQSPGPTTNGHYNQGPVSRQQPSQQQCNMNTSSATHPAMKTADHPQPPLPGATSSGGNKPPVGTSPYPSNHHTPSFNYPTTNHPLSHQAPHHQPHPPPQLYGTAHSTSHHGRNYSPTRLSYNDLTQAFRF